MTEEQLEIALGEIAKEHANKAISAAKDMIKPYLEQGQVEELRSAQTNLVIARARLEAEPDEAKQKDLWRLVREREQALKWSIETERLNREWVGIDSRNSLFESLRAIAEYSGPIVLALVLARVKG